MVNAILSAAVDTSSDSPFSFSLKQIFITLKSKGPEDWRTLLADPEIHWRRGYSARTLAHSWEDCNGEPGDKILVKDVIADVFFQQVLTRPTEFDVVATMNLNGDYISDALAAQVGGIGIAPGANINFDTGISLFEATHGTAPKYAGQDKVNPSSLILSGVLMFQHLGWDEVGETIVNGMVKAFKAKTVTYDFHRLMEGATLLKCSEFAKAVTENFSTKS